MLKVSFWLLLVIGASRKAQCLNGVGLGRDVLSSSRLFDRQLANGANRNRTFSISAAVLNRWTIKQHKIKCKIAASDVRVEGGRGGLPSLLCLCCSVLCVSQHQQVNITTHSLWFFGKVWNVRISHVWKHHNTVHSFIWRETLSELISQSLRSFNCPSYSFYKNITQTQFSCEILPMKAAIYTCRILSRRKDDKPYKPLLCSFVKTVVEKRILKARTCKEARPASCVWTALTVALTTAASVCVTMEMTEVMMWWQWFLVHMFCSADKF